jgi:hypothetical protein
MFATLLLLHTTQGRVIFDQVFLRQQEKYTTIPIADQKAATVVPPLGYDRSKQHPFPRSKNSYRFVIDQLKRHHFGWLLEENFDSLQLEYLFTESWHVCRPLYKDDGSHPRFSHSSCTETPKYPSVISEHNDQMLYPANFPAEIMDLTECPYNPAVIRQELLDRTQVEGYYLDHVVVNKTGVLTSEKFISGFVASVASDSASSSSANASDEASSDGSSTGSGYSRKKNHKQSPILAKQTTKKRKKQDRSSLWQVKKGVMTYIVKRRDTIVKHKIKKEKISGTGATATILTDVFKFLPFLEHALSFHAFVKYGGERLPLHLRSNVNGTEAAIRELVRLFDQYIYRGDDTLDSKTPKMHAHLHMGANIPEYGWFMQYDAGMGERGLKDWAKKISKTAQKRGNAIFLHQTCARIYDAQVLAKAIRVAKLHFLPPPSVESHGEEMEEDISSNESSTEGARTGHEVPRTVMKRKNPHFRICNATGEVTSLNRKGRAIKNSLRMLDPLIVTTLRKKVAHDQEDIEVWTEVEATTAEGEKIRYRADPCYDDKGYWYDWVMTRFNDMFGEVGTAIPCKLLCFYKSFDGTDMALAHCCGWEANQGDGIDDSNLIQHWKLEYTSTGKPIIMGIELSAIDEGTLVIENKRTHNGIPKQLNRKEVDEQTVLRVTCRKDHWPLTFSEWGAYLVRQQSET